MKFTEIPASAGTKRFKNEVLLFLSKLTCIRKVRELNGIFFQGNKIQIYLCSNPRNKTQNMKNTVNILYCIRSFDRYREKLPWIISVSHFCECISISSFYHGIVPKYLFFVIWTLRCIHKYPGRATLPDSCLLLDHAEHSNTFHIQKINPHSRTTLLQLVCGRY